MNVIIQPLPYQGVECFCYSEFHKRVFCVNSNKDLIVFDVDTLSHTTFDLSESFFDGCIACHPRKPVVAISFGWDLWQSFDWQVGETKQICRDAGKYKHFKFSQDGDMVFSKNSVVWILRDGASEAQRVGRHHNVSIVNISHSGEFIVSGGWDHHILIWFLFENLGWARIRDISTGGTVYFANFDATNRLITQSLNQPLVLWDEYHWRQEFGQIEDVKKQMMTFCPHLESFADMHAKGIPEYCAELDSWIVEMHKLNNSEVVFLNNFGQMFVARKRMCKENILAANFALAKCGLHRDVREAVFRSLGVLDDTFRLRKFYTH